MEGSLETPCIGVEGEIWASLVFFFELEILHSIYIFLSLESFFEYPAVIQVL